MVLRNTGPKGGPGMPEYGQLPIPDYLLAQGVRDMVRVSDARMSGTSYGACVLHVAPEAAVGGPLALVRTGDLITLDVSARTLSLHISERQVASRQASWTPPRPRFSRGYGALYTETSPRPTRAAIRLPRQAWRVARARPAVGCLVTTMSMYPQDAGFVAIEEIHAAAIKNLPRDVADFLEGGAGTESTLRANRKVFGRWLTRPRPMSGVSVPRTSTELTRHPARDADPDRAVRRRRHVRGRRASRGGPRERRVRHGLDRAGGRHFVTRRSPPRPRRPRGSPSSTRMSPSTTWRSGSGPWGMRRCA